MKYVYCKKCGTQLINLSTEENEYDFWCDKCDISYRVIDGNVFPINWRDIEIIKGQDHDYWIYSNKADKYMCANVSWNEFDEDEFVSIFEDDIAKILSVIDEYGISDIYDV